MGNKTFSLWSRINKFITSYDIAIHAICVAPAQSLNEAVWSYQQSASGIIHILCNEFKPHRLPGQMPKSLKLELNRDKNWLQVGHKFNLK